jgi:hypothetical protein
MQSKLILRKTKEHDVLSVFELLPINAVLIPKPPTIHLIVTPFPSIIRRLAELANKSGGMTTGAVSIRSSFAESSISMHVVSFVAAAAMAATKAAAFVTTILLADIL